MGKEINNIDLYILFSRKDERLLEGSLRAESEFASENILARQI